MHMYTCVHTSRYLPRRGILNASKTANISEPPKISFVCLMMVQIKFFIKAIKPNIVNINGDQRQKKRKRIEGFEELEK